MDGKLREARTQRQQSYPRKPTRRGDDVDEGTKTNYVRSSFTNRSFRLSNLAFVLPGWLALVEALPNTGSDVVQGWLLLDRHPN